MRALVILSLVAFAACSPTGSISADQPDAAPIKLPPQGKPGGDTAPACQGVPASGQCAGGVAQYCDVTSGSLRQVDCQALGQTCVIDPQAGASCASLGLSAPVDGQPCGGVVNDTGFCTADGAAVWCDADSNQVVAWGCESGGLSCGVDQCQSGAYCCQADPQQDECDRLGFYGECNGDQARYCTGSDTLIELDCAAQGKVCALNDCAEGAYCCDPPDQPVEDCERIGVYGECGGADGNTLRYCAGGTVYEYACAGAGGTCALDVCFDGADCCTQAEIDDACTTLGLSGTCGGPRGNVAMWCDNGQIRQEDCEATGTTCGVDVCDVGAKCC